MINKYFVTDVFIRIFFRILSSQFGHISVHLIFIPNDNNISNFIPVLFPVAIKKHISYFPLSFSRSIFLIYILYIYIYAYIYIRIYKYYKSYGNNTLGRNVRSCSTYTEGGEKMFPVFMIL